MRRDSLALRRGALLPLYADEESLLFLRVYGAQRLLVALTRRGEASINLPQQPLLAGNWQSLLGEAQLAQSPEGLQLQQCGPIMSLWQAAELI